MSLSAGNLLPFQAPRNNAVHCGGFGTVGGTFSIAGEVMPSGPNRHVLQR